MTEPDQLPALYRDVFDVDRRGAAILEDLVRRFGHAKVHTDGGIDAVLKTYRAAARREVLDYIALQINRANGVDDQPPEGDPQP
jgi:hypothetical protein